VKDPAKLFLVALVGVLAAIGLAISALGIWVLASYSGVVLVLGALMVKRARRAAQASRHSDGRTCSCCTTTVFDPVEVRQ
jgi:hypothetical protein